MGTSARLSGASLSHPAPQRNGIGVKAFQNEAPRAGAARLGSRIGLARNAAWLQAEMQTARLCG